MTLNLYNHQYVDSTLIYFALKPFRTKLDIGLLANIWFEHWVVVLVEGASLSILWLLVCSLLAT